MQRCTTRSADALLLLSCAFAVHAAPPAHPATHAAASPPSGAVVYDLSIKPAEPDAQTLVTRFVVDAGKVRIGGATAKRVYLFEDRVMTVIDNIDSSVHTLKHATFEQYSAHYAEVLRQLEQRAAEAPPEAKSDADGKVANMQAALERQQHVAVRNYRLTEVTDSVDGHTCRLWEAREEDIKHFEFCVVSTAALPGAAQILEGIKTLSEFREGSKFALGIDFGNAPWWEDIFRFGGLPVLIREYRFGAPANEITLSGIHTGVPAAGAFDVPAAYRHEDGPDYAQWYVR